MKAAIYARLSRNRNGEKSDTLEDQIAGCQRLADAAGWEVIETITDDDISGRRADRDGFDRLTHLVASGILNVVLVRDTERLFRNQPAGRIFRALCADNDVDIRTWGGTEPRLSDDGGIVVTGVKDLVAEEYARSVSKNVKNWHRRRTEAGRVNVPGTMFGERSEGEAEVVRDLAQMALKGTSLRAMCRWLNERGIKTTRGNDWSPTTVRGLLKNPRLAGILVSEGEEVGEIEGYEPILDRETHEKVKLILTNSPVYAAPPKGRRPHLLTGLLVCSSCGHEMRKSNNGSQDTYRCVAERPCPRRMTVTAVSAEEHIAMATFQRVSDLPVADEPSDDQLNAVTLELAELREKRSALTESYMNDLIDRAMLETRLKELKAREKEVKATVRVPTNLADRNLVDLFALLDDPEWRKVEAEQVRALIHGAVERVVVHKGQVRGPRFDPNRLEIEWRPA